MGGLMLRDWGGQALLAVLCFNYPTKQNFPQLNLPFNEPMLTVRDALPDKGALFWGQEQRRFYAFATWMFN